MRGSYGYGLIVAILLAIVLYLFSIINLEGAVSAFFLLVGLWTIIFGLTATGEKTYYVGWGAVIAVLSTFIVLPLAYTIGLVLIVAIVVTIFTASRSKGTVKTATQPTDSSK